MSRNVSSEGMQQLGPGGRKFVVARAVSVAAANVSARARRLREMRLRRREVEALRWRDLANDATRPDSADEYW